MDSQNTTSKESKIHKIEIATTSLVQLIRKNYSLIEPELEPYYDSLGKYGKSIKDSRCLRFKKQNDIVLIRVDNNPEKLQKDIDNIKKDPLFENKTIRGIVIIPFNKEFANPKDDNESVSKVNNNIRVLYCKIDFYITKNHLKTNGIRIKLENIIKLREDWISDYFYDHLSHIEDNLLPYKAGYEGCREYEIDDKHKLDLYCKDEKGRIVVIENKRSTKYLYESVGQILCYLSLAEKDEEQTIKITADDIRGTILIPDETDDTTKEDIQTAIDYSRCLHKIDLLFYSAELSFV